MIDTESGVSDSIVGVFSLLLLLLLLWVQDGQLKLQVCVKLPRQVCIGVSTSFSYPFAKALSYSLLAAWCQHVR